MKNIFVLVLMTLTVGAYAQEAKKVKLTKEHINDFFQTKTYFVKDNNPLIGYNMEMMSAVKKSWTITDYEIIDWSAMEALSKDSKNAFVFLSKVERKRDEEEVYYLYVNVVMGDKSGDISLMPELLVLPLSYTGADEEDYADKLPLMFTFIQKHLTKMKQETDFASWLNLKSYNFDGVRKLKKMTLIVNKRDLGETLLKDNKYKQLYHGLILVVDDEEMKACIDNKDEDSAVLHWIAPNEDENDGFAYCEIIDIETGEMLYYNSQKINKYRPKGLAERDMKAIQGKLF